jgi:hypothetical protein
MKQCHYFVSFQYKNQGDSGFGQINLLLKDKVTGPEQIDELTAYLKDKFKHDGVVIINLILLKEEVLSVD